MPGGSSKPGDDIWNEIQYPVAHRLLDKCDAVLRLEGGLSVPITTFA